MDRTTIKDLYDWINAGGLPPETVLYLDGDGTLCADVPGKAAMTYLHIGFADEGDPTGGRMMSDTLVSEVKSRLYLHGLDAETLRYLGDALDQHADTCHAAECETPAKKMTHAHSSMLRLWAERFWTDANRLEDADGE